MDKITFDLASFCNIYFSMLTSILVSLVIVPYAVKKAITHQASGNIKAGASMSGRAEVIKKKAE
jgi:multidrug efflux pump subunit AcrB